MGALKTLAFVANHPLNRAHRVAALSRFVRLQLAGRLVARPLAVPFVNDTQLFIQRGMTGVTGNWYCGLHEPAEMGFVLHVLRPTDSFVDVGANAGSYSVLAAGAVGARTVAVEPVPSTFERLQANVRLNALDDLIEVHRLGLSEEKGELLFTTEHDTGNRVAIPNETRATTRVPVTTLDDLLHGRTPAVIKIDVEGHEPQVLAGAGRTLSSDGLVAVLMETNHTLSNYGANAADIIATMKRFGLEPHRYDPFERKILPYVAGQENTIFLRSPSEVQRRCSDAPRFALVNGSI